MTQEISEHVASGNEIEAEEVMEGRRDKFASGLRGDAEVFEGGVWNQLCVYYDNELTQITHHPNTPTLSSAAWSLLHSLTSPANAMKPFAGNMNRTSCIPTSYCR